MFVVTPMKPYFQDQDITLYLGDAFEILPSLSGVDLVVTDPPYSFGLASTAQEGKHGGWMDLMNAAVWYREMLIHFKRLTESKVGAAWVFNAWRSFPVLARASFLAEWPIASLGIWDKQWIGPGGPNGLRPSYEQVALFPQPSFRIEDRGVSDLFPCKWGSHKPTGHSAEKPVPLLRRLIEISLPASTKTEQPRVVLDAFAGSGRTLIAARQLGLRAIGIEGDERWCEFIAKDISSSPQLPFE